MDTESIPPAPDREPTAEPPALPPEARSRLALEFLNLDAAGARWAGAFAAKLGVDALAAGAVPEDRAADWREGIELFNKGVGVPRGGALDEARVKRLTRTLRGLVASTSTETTPPPLLLELTARVGDGPTRYDLVLVSERGRVELLGVAAASLRSYSTIQSLALAARRPVALPSLGRKTAEIWSELLAEALGRARHVITHGESEAELVAQAMRDGLRTLPRAVEASAAALEAGELVDRGRHLYVTRGALAAVVVRDLPDLRVTADALARAARALGMCVVRARFDDGRPRAWRFPARATGGDR